MRRREVCMPSRLCRIAVWTLLPLAVGCQRASSTSRPPDDPAAREQGERITQRMLEVYRNSKSYTDHATYVEQSVLRGDGVERQLPFFQMSLALDRPNRLRLTFDEAIAGSAGRKGYDIACDGRRLRTAAAEVPKQIQESAAPKKLTSDNFVTDPLVRDTLLYRSLGDVFPQLAMLLDDEASPVFPSDERPRLVGTTRLRGRECFRVASTNPEGVRILWIDSENYLLQRMELPVEAHRRAIDPDKHYIDLAVWIDFEDATTDAQIDAEIFVLGVPDDARRVRRFVPPPQTATVPRPIEINAEGDLASSTEMADLDRALARFERDLAAATISDSAP